MGGGSALPGALRAAAFYGSRAGIRCAASGSPCAALAGVCARARAAPAWLWRACAGKPGRRAVCKPRVFRSSHSRLYLNVSPSAVSVAGIARGVGRGCSLVAATCICTGMMKTAVFSLTHTHSHKHTHTHIHVHTRTHTYAHAHSQITCRSQCERFLHAYTHTQTHMQRRRLGERGRSGSARGQKCRSLCTTWMTPR